MGDPFFNWDFAFENSTFPYGEIDAYPFYINSISVNCGIKVKMKTHCEKIKVTDYWNDYGLLNFLSLQKNVTN